MKKLLLFIGLLVSISCIGQNGLDESKDKVILITKGYPSKFRNIEVKDDILAYDLYIDDIFYSREIKYFMNDTCYKYSSITLVENFDLEKEVLKESFGIPVLDNVWTYYSSLKTYRIVTIHKNSSLAIVTMMSFKSNKVYLAVLDYLINNSNN